MAFPSTTGPNSYIWNLKQVYNARLGDNWPTSGLGLFAGGYVAPGAVNVIDYVNFVSTGNAIDFGDLYTAVYIQSAAGVPTRELLLVEVHQLKLMSFNILTYHLKEILWILVI